MLAIKGMLAAVDAACDVGGRRGMESGRFGLAVAEVGKGGKERISGDIPGMRSATTFWILLAFLEILSKRHLINKKKQLTSMRSQFGGGASARMCKIRSLMS